MNKDFWNIIILRLVWRALYLRTLRKGIVGRVRRSIDEMLVFIDEDFEKRVLCLLVTDEFIGMQVIEFSSCVRLLLMRW